MHPVHPCHIWVRQLGCRALAEVGYSLATESSVWNKTIPGPMEELGLHGNKTTNGGDGTGIETL